MSLLLHLNFESVPTAHAPFQTGAAGGAGKPAPAKLGWSGLVTLSMTPAVTASPASSGPPSVAHNPFVSPRYAAVSPNPEGPCSSVSTAVASFGLTGVSLNCASLKT